MNILLPIIRKCLNTGIVLCILCNTYSFGQSYQFKNYSVEDGLAQLEIRSICQDKFSNIWFGTNGGGISVFDGIRFVNFTENDGLISDKVNYIFNDNEGDLWICTNKGLSFIKGNSFEFGNNITPTFINYSTSSGLADENVWCAMQDKDGFIWFGTNDGLSKLKSKEDQKEGNIFFNTKLGLSHQVVYSILQDSKEVFWIGTKNGLTRYDQATPRGKSYQYYFQKDGLSNDSVFTLFEDSRGVIWAGTGEGFATYNPNKISGSTITFSPATKIGKEKLNKIGSIIEDRNGDIWLGCWAGLGAYKYNPNKNRYYRYTTQNGLVGDNVISMFIDQEKNLWYGTYGMGVSKLTDRKFEIYSKADGLPDNIIWSVVEDINGNIWIGNNFGGVSRLVRREGDIYNTENYKIQNYSTENGFIGDRVNSISSDRSGDLWFCSEEGLSRLSMPIPVYYGKGSRTRRLNFQNYTINTGLDKRRVNAFYEDRYGNKWLAYTGGGVSLINIKGNKLNTIPIGNPVLKTFDTYTIFQDKIGDLWFATNGGVVRCKMNPLTGKIKSFISITEKDGLLSNDVRSIVQDLDGNLWLGTAAGIVMFNPNDPESKMVSFTSKDGLSSDKITLLVFDENQNLWIGTKEGINKFSTKKYYRIIKKFDEMQGELIESRLEKFKHYGFMEGFTGSETNINAVCKDKEGNLWFGTRRGTMKYVENEDRINKIPPSIRIDGIHVFSERFPAEDKMKLFYDQNYLTISYIGVSHSIPEKVSYKYMLRGVDRQWQLNGYSRTVNYENLAPGEYTFLVKACNSDGVWAEEPARLDFVIMPPFWSTNWFYIIVGLFVGCMVYLVVLIRLRNLRLMTAELERQVDNKTRELSLSELQYGTLFEKISDSIFIIDKQSHKFLDCNEAVLKVYDYTKEELKGMTPLDLHPEEEHKKAAANIGISTSGRPKSYTHITKSGQVIFVEIASDHIEYNGKDAMISIVRDVTERRRSSYEITKMNKELTSSIRYTKRILDSVLKDKEEFSKLFENSFILFKPRGIVSGDFFWYNKVDEKIVVAVIDCTGHGIAGAFMSMVGNGLLNKIVLENNILNPGEILKELHTGVVSALNKEERDSMTLDGMDMGICVIDMQNNTIEASSASRPVILVRDKEYKIIKGKSKLPIGLALGDKRTYKTEKIDYQQGDSIYLLTDGYCDQFGGKEGEKFMSERFLKLLVKIQELSMPNQGVELNNIIEEWKGTREQIDDILVLGFRI